VPRSIPTTTRASLLSGARGCEAMSRSSGIVMTTSLDIERAAAQ
jgi:hypothetical protein